MAKGQITITLKDTGAKYVQALADQYYDGNFSMAIRKIVADHSRLVNHKVKD